MTQSDAWPAGLIGRWLGHLVGRPAHTVERSSTDAACVAPGGPRRVHRSAGPVHELARQVAACRWRPALGQGHKQGGFTLVEIMVVVFILAIAAGVVIPQVIDSSDIQSISAARMIATDLQYAQNLAITTQKPVRLVFNKDAESYQLVYYDHTTNQSTAVEHPINKGSYTVSFGSLQGFGKLDLVSAVFASNAYVEFNSIGAPDNAGQIVVQAGSQSCTIAVSAATGKVTVTTN